MKAILVFLFTCFVATASGQGLPAYKIYDSKGKSVSYKKMVKALAKGDVVLFGEIHNNPIAHWLQMKVAHSLHVPGSLMIGAEMIETDNQDALDSYLAGEIDLAGLDTLARLWSNFKTDYLPLVDFARANNITYVGTNVPRRYARMVYRGGFGVLDTLPENEKAWMAPLPIAFDSTLPMYMKILDMMGDHGTPELVKAQALKDATMAHVILTHFSPGVLFLHLNGAYHSDFYEGILWYLQLSRPDLLYTTITTVSQKDTSKLSKDNLGRADYIICVDADMPVSY